MNLSEFYNEVSRFADTEGTKINVADVRRVLSVAFDVLEASDTEVVLDLVSKGIKASAKRKCEE